MLKLILIFLLSFTGSIQAIELVAENEEEYETMPHEELSEEEIQDEEMVVPIDIDKGLSPQIPLDEDAQ